MNYYKFARRTNGTLKFLFKVSEKLVTIPSNDECVYYHENDIENAKDNFTVAKMRIVKNGKTWLNFINNK